MVPPVDMGGWDVRFTMWRRFNYISGSVSGLIRKSMASGYGNGVSGITLTNSGTGIFNVSIAPNDFSGHFDPHAYAYRIERFDSGNANILVEGHRLVKG